MKRFKNKLYNTVMNFVNYGDIMSASLYLKTKWTRLTKKQLQNIFIAGIYNRRTEDIQLKSTFLLSLDKRKNTLHPKEALEILCLYRKDGKNLPLKNIKIIIDYFNLNLSEPEYKEITKNIISNYILEYEKQIKEKQEKLQKNIELLDDKEYPTLGLLKFNVINRIRESFSILSYLKGDDQKQFLENIDFFIKKGFPKEDLFNLILDSSYHPKTVLDIYGLLINEDEKMFEYIKTSERKLTFLKKISVFEKSSSLITNILIKDTKTTAKLLNELFKEKDYTSYNHVFKAVAHVIDVKGVINEILDNSKDKINDYLCVNRLLCNLKKEDSEHFVKNNAEKLYDFAFNIMMSKESLNNEVYNSLFTAETRRLVTKYGVDINKVIKKHLKMKDKDIEELNYYLFSGEKKEIKPEIIEAVYTNAILTPGLKGDILCENLIAYNYLSKEKVQSLKPVIFQLMEENNNLNKNFKLELEKKL